jgi:AcrR family transcriptional regulator
VTCPAENAPRWRRRPSERPDEILGAALEVFANQGLAGARVEDIAARAGVSKGTVYLYFPGKDELFREAVRAKVRRTIEELSRAAPPGGDPIVRLARFVDTYWAQLRRKDFGQLYRLVLSELHQFPELSRFYAEEVSGRVVELTSEIVAEGVASGVFREVAPGTAARMVVALLAQHAVWTSRREIFPHLGKRSDEELVNDIKDFVFSALATGADPSPGGSA